MGRGSFFALETPRVSLGIEEAGPDRPGLRSSVEEWLLHVEGSRVTGLASDRKDQDPRAGGKSVLLTESRGRILGAQVEDVAAARPEGGVVAKVVVRVGHPRILEDPGCGGVLPLKRRGRDYDRRAGNVMPCEVAEEELDRCRAVRLERLGRVVQEADVVLDRVVARDRVGVSCVV